MTGFCNEAFKDLAFVIHGAPQIVHLAVDLHVHLVKVPSPMGDAPHPAYPLPSDVPREHRAKPVPPEPNRLMAKIDASLKQQVFHIPQRQRKPHVHHDYEANDFGGRLEAPERTVWFCSRFSFHARPLPAVGAAYHVGLTVPRC